MLFQFYLLLKINPYFNKFMTHTDIHKNLMVNNNKL